VYSVVVPTYNRAQTLAATLDSVLMQDVDFSYEVIVVDNNSSDETREVVYCFERKAPGAFRYLFEGTQGASAARNAGIRVAKGEIIAFTDDDIITQPNWLRSLAAAYKAHPDAWSVGGRIILELPLQCPMWFDPMSPVLTELLGLMDRGDETVKIAYPDTVWGGNFSMTRECLSRVGFFNTRLGVGFLSSEDNEMCHRIQRAGGAVYYCGQAAVIHLVPRARMTKHFFRKRVYWDGRSDAIVFPQDPRRPAWKKAASIGLDTLKKWAHALGCYMTGDTSQAFECELKARRRFGYLYQTIIAGMERPQDVGSQRTSLTRSRIPRRMP